MSEYQNIVNQPYFNLENVKSIFRAAVYRTAKMWKASQASVSTWFVSKWFWKGYGNL